VLQAEAKMTGRAKQRISASGLSFVFERQEYGDIVLPLGRVA